MLSSSYKKINIIILKWEMMTDNVNKIKNPALRLITSQYQLLSVYNVALNWTAFNYSG